MKAEQQRNQNRHTSDKLESSFPFYGLDEQRSLERTPACSHVQSKVDACGKRWKIEYYEHIPENFPAKDGDGAPSADSLNLSLVTCRSLGRGKRGTKTHFPISPLHQKVLDLSLTKSPLKAPSPLLPSRSRRRGQFDTSGDTTVSSEFRINSPYAHLRKEVETPHGIEYITSSRKKSSRLRVGLFLGLSSCCKNNTIVSGNLKHKRTAKLHETKSLPASNESWEQDRAWNVIANVDNHTINKKVVLKKSLTADAPDAAKSVEALPSVAFSDGSTREVEPHVSLPTVSVPLEIYASNSCNFRLSTSSADASLEADAFAWDKEHSSFTSEDSTLTFLELLKPGRSEHKTRDEISARESSIVVSSCDQEPAIAASVVSQRQIPSFTGMDLNSVVEEVPDAEGQGENPSTTHVAKKYDNDPLEDLSLNVQRKLQESVAMVVVSDDPYHDFMQSMLEMVIENKLSKSVELEELLQYYLSLNPPCFHDVVVEAFTDLWLQLLHIS